MFIPTFNYAINLLIINNKLLLMAITTIPVKVETKKRLEGMKGDKTWDEFLDELANLMRLEKRLKYRKRMKELLEMGYEEVRVKGWAREYS